MDECKPVFHGFLQRQDAKEAKVGRYKLTPG